jgi:hypothetical protein
MTIATKQPDASPLIGASRLFIGAVAATGAIVTLLVFFLVQKEVLRGLEQQPNTIITQALSQLQKQVNQDQIFVKSVATVMGPEQNVTPKTTDYFLDIAKKKGITTSYVYRFETQKGTIGSPWALLNLTPKGGRVVSPDNLPDLRALAHMAYVEDRSLVLVLSEKNHPSEKWLAIAHPARSKFQASTAVVIGLTPLSRLF